MDEKSAAERAAIEREARSAVAARSASGSDARQDALRRYLGAERYHEKRLEQAEDAEREAPDADRQD
jgi:hypothetical protein